jgi:hypothetical protein
MKKKFFRTIVFTKSQLTGYFRFENVFQIYPCDFPNAPKSYYCHDFPAVIEYWVDIDEEIEIADFWEDLKGYAGETAKQINRRNKLLRLLSGITNHRFFVYDEIGFRWGHPLPEKEMQSKEDKETINKHPSQTTLLSYSYPDMWKDLQLTDFSEKKHPDVQTTGHLSYYINDPIDERTREIRLPATINRTLQKYFDLDTKTQNIIDTITHLICNGIDLHQKMRSLSFLSYVSAIETIANYEYRNLKDEIEFECHDCQTVKSSPVMCQKCGRPIWGVKVKFKTFLRTYVAYSDESVKKFNKIYNLRSQIVHNGVLLLGDEKVNWSNSPKGESQYMSHLETKQAAKIGLVNWLIMGPNKKMVTEDPQEKKQN